MRKFNIGAMLPNGNAVVANVVALDEAAAIARIKATEQFREFIGDTLEEDVVFTCNGSEPLPQTSPDTCELLESIGSDCVVEHKKSGVVVSFRAGRFNSTVKIVRTPVVLIADEIATIMREVGEWLYCFHRGKMLDLRAITLAFLHHNRMPRTQLAEEIGANPYGFSYYLQGKRGLPYEQLERLLTILRQAGEL